MSVDDVFERNIEALLDDAGIENYKPETNIYTSWYRIPFRFEFSEKKGETSWFYPKRRAKVKCGGLDAKESAYTAIHEMSHIDLVPLELLLCPPIFGFIPIFAWLTASCSIPVKIALTLASLSMLWVYHRYIRDSIIDTYTRLKLGDEIYSKLRAKNR